ISESIFRLEYRCVLGVNQLRGQYHVLIQSAQRVRQIAWVEGNLDCLAVVCDWQLDVGGPLIRSLADKLEQTGPEMEIDASTFVACDNRRLFDGAQKRP